MFIPCSNCGHYLYGSEGRYCEFDVDGTGPIYDSTTNECVKWEDNKILSLDAAILMHKSMADTHAKMGNELLASREQQTYEWLKELKALKKQKG